MLPTAKLNCFSKFTKHISFNWASSQNVPENRRQTQFGPALAGFSFASVQALRNHPLCDTSFSAALAASE